jgi:U3 small nucleolar RNA-associated protein 6
LGPGHDWIFPGVVERIHPSKMAERVQAELEALVPEIRDLEAKGILNKEEVKSVVARRRDFEYLLRRKVSVVGDYLKAIAYELNLEALRRKRKARLGTCVIATNTHVCLHFAGVMYHSFIHSLIYCMHTGIHKTSISDHGGLRRVRALFDRAVKRFTGDERLWLQYAHFIMRTGHARRLTHVFAR